MCQFSKYGYCKYKDSCDKRHFNEECQELSSCQNIKNCHKRHPRICKRFILGSHCRFKSDCSYKHKDTTNKVESELLSIVNALENMVSEMTVKLTSLEMKLKEFEKVPIPSENIEEKV